MDGKEDCERNSKIVSEQSKSFLKRLFGRHCNTRVKLGESPLNRTSTTFSSIQLVGSDTQELKLESIGQAAQASPLLETQSLDGDCKDADRLRYLERLLEERDEQICSLRRDLFSLQGENDSSDSKLTDTQLELNLRRDEAKSTQIKLASLKRENEELKRGKPTHIDWSREVEEQLGKAISEAVKLQEEVDTLKRDKGSLSRALAESEKQLRQLIEIANIPELSLRKTGKKVASGAFGDVFIGVWRRVNVAIKSFHEEIQEGNNRLIFEQEIAVCCRIHHPNIVCTFGILRVSGKMPEIVMELLECSLAQLMLVALRSPRYLTLREQLDICADALAGISYLHEMLPEPLLHGDIRCSNILITTTMGAKIADFGASHFIRSSLSIGPLSLEYLAPERTPSQQGRSLSNTPQADMYSLGVTLVEVLTGEKAMRKARHRQLRQVTHLKLRDMCIQMTEDQPANRLTADQAYDVIETVRKTVEYSRCPPRRKVSRMEGDQFISLSALA